MKKEELTKRISGIENTIGTLRGKITNAISDEARAEIEGHITELEQAAAALREIEAAAIDGEDDKSEEMRSQMAEIIARINEIESTMKNTENLENNLKKVANSKEFAQAFMDTVHNSKTASDFRKNWKETAGRFIQNNIDAGDVQYFLPGFIVNEINDQFVGRRHRLLELVDWTGLPMFQALWETGNDMANVHTAGTQKTEQTLEFDPIQIRPAIIYKYIKLDKLVIKESEGYGDVLLRYVTAELLDRLLSTIENYIVSGTAPFLKASEKVYGNTPEAIEYMDDIDGAIAIMSKSVYVSAKAGLQSGLSHLVTHDDMLAYFGVEEIVFNETTFTPSTAGATWTGILYLRPRDYKLVGDRRPDQYNDFNLEYNQEEYLTEIYIGGGCVKPNNFVATYTL